MSKLAKVNLLATRLFSLFLVVLFAGGLPATAGDLQNDVPIPTAIQFPVVFQTPINSKYAKIGDIVTGELKEDLTIEQRVVAPAGSIIKGHIEALEASRRLGTSIWHKKHRFHPGCSMKIVFDEIVEPDNTKLSIVGCLSKQKITLNNEAQPREIEVGDKGELKKAEAVFTTKQMVVAQAVNLGSSTGLGQLGAVASFGALPVVMGALGAIDPSIVAPKPLSEDEKHPRVKGFALGVMSSLPGAPVVQAFAFKGSEVRIERGDEFLVQAHTPYPEESAKLAVSAAILPKK